MRREKMRCVITWSWPTDITRAIRRRLSKRCRGRADHGKHVVQIEGLAQIRHAQSRQPRLHMVGLGSACAHIHHGDTSRGKLRVQGTQNAQSIESAQRVIEQDDPGFGVARVACDTLQQRERLGAGRDGAHIVAFLFEDEAQHIA